MSDSGLTAPRRLPLPVLLGAGLLGALLAGTAAMWVYFGSAVFYEMIAAGIAACF